MAPWLQSELEPNIPGSTHPGTRPAAQPAEPKWLRCWARPGRPWTSCPNSPMKSWFAIMIKEATRIAEILTPADFIGHHGKPPYINPGSHSILRVKWDAGIGPRRIGLEGSWAARRGTRRI